MYASPYVPFDIEKPSAAPPQAWPFVYANPQSPEIVAKEHISNLLAAKYRVFSVSGKLSVDHSEFVLFFRTKSGIAYAIDFPVNLEFNMPPAMEVLIAACNASQTPDYREEEPLYVPRSMSVTTSFELANHPILEAVKAALFPALTDGHHLTATTDKLEILVRGSRLIRQSTPPDGRVATIIVLLPSICRGGIVSIDNPDGSRDTFGSGVVLRGDMEWIAFFADSDYEVALVEGGCRMFISYGVHIKSPGPSGRTGDLLIQPTDRILESLSSYIGLVRGKTVAFWVSNTYGVNPAEVLAESLVPMLKGGDLVLYTALKHCGLEPELRWSAGGYIWPVGHTIELSTLDPGVGPTTPPLRGTFSGEIDNDYELRFKVENSGAVPLHTLGIEIVTDWHSQDPLIVGKERLPISTGYQVGKMGINVLMVVEIL